MPLRHPSEVNFADTWKLIQAFREDPTAVETHDEAFWQGGCWNNFLRTQVPIPFGSVEDATLPGGELIADLTDGEVVAALEKHLPQAEVAAYGSAGEPSQAIPWSVVAPIVLEFVLRILRRRAA